jgi:hypothetical protein
VCVTVAKIARARRDEKESENSKNQNAKQSSSQRDSMLKLQLDLRGI